MQLTEAGAVTGGLDGFRETQILLYSYGRFGGGHLYFHVIRHYVSRPGMSFARPACIVWS